jgi:GH25 family lysozyme M1 (1,4-beta-N-acetylmuramidase)
MALTLIADVSHYQGPIDWATVARTPYRAGVARMTIGRTTRDDRGRQNLRAMLGIMPVAGAYGVVGYSDPVEDGAKLLLDEIAAVGADPAKILVMLDAENFSKLPDGTVPHPTIDQVDRYARQLRADLGRWPVAYVPDWWLDGHGFTVAGRALANCPWAPSEYFAAPWTETRLLAHKPTSLHGFKSLGWLQFTSSATIAGISGLVDANVFYGTLDQMRAQLIGGTMSATGPEHWDDADWAAHDKHVSDVAVGVIRTSTTGDATVGARNGYFTPLANNAKAAADSAKAAAAGVVTLGAEADATQAAIAALRVASGDPTVIVDAIQALGPEVATLVNDELARRQAS